MVRFVTSEILVFSVRIWSTYTYWCTCVRKIQAITFCYSWIYQFLVTLIILLIVLCHWIISEWSLSLISEHSMGFNALLVYCNLIYHIFYLLITISFFVFQYHNWECGKTHHYHCHVWKDGSFSFQVWNTFSFCCWVQILIFWDSVIWPYLFF